MDSGLHPFDEHVLSILSFLSGILKKSIFLVHMGVRNEHIPYEETTNPLDYTTLELIKEVVLANRDGNAVEGYIPFS